MSDLEVPWAIHHSEHSARLARVQAQQLLGTGSGVSRPGDLKVLPLEVPGNGFRVMPGGGTAQSRDTDASARESYGPLLGSELTVTDVPGTGSGETRRDLVILEITDPAMQSVTYPAPTDPEYTGGWLDGDNFNRITVIPNVGASVTRLEQITTGDYAHVTGITLAAINWPESTSTIGPGAAPSPGLASIEDLRELQRPRTDRVFRPTDIVSLQRINGTGSEGNAFPNEFTSLIGQVDIPEWATHARVSMTWAGVRIPTGASTGQYWVQIGINTDPNRVIGPSSSFDPDTTAEMYREAWIYGATVAIPAALRGTRKSVIPKARVNDSRPVAQQPYIDTAGSAILDIEFFERAV